VKEIVIPKRLIILSLVLVSLAAAGVWYAPQIFDKSLAQTDAALDPSPTASDQAGAEDAAAKEAALAGARAFYTVDYSTGQQQWLNRLCSVSTQTGCTVYQNVIVPNLWRKLEEGKTVTSVIVTAQEKVQEEIASTRGNAPTQIWRLKIRLSSPWPVQKDPITEFTSLAMVIKEDGAWKFERFLTEEELKAFSPEGGQP
jgi:hypothetical protein